MMFINDLHVDPDDKRPLYYRYEERRYAGMYDDYRGDFGPGHTELTLRQFHLIKKTPRGAWLDTGFGRRFVLDGSRKRYAHETKELALESYRARKRKQIKIIKAQLADAEYALALADRVAPAGCHTPLVQAQGT